MIGLSQIQVGQAVIARVGMIGAENGAEGSAIPNWCHQEGIDWDAVCQAAVDSAANTIRELRERLEVGDEIDFETEMQESLATEFRQGLLTGFVIARRDELSGRAT